MEKWVVDNIELLGEIERLLAMGKLVEMTPSGRSMLPFIKGDRDTVTLERCETLNVGDIALAKITANSGKIAEMQLTKYYVLHRVIAIDGDDVVLMGDGNITGQERCKTSDVIGIVVGIHDEKGNAKRLSKGRIWYRLLPIRKWLLKAYRKIEKIKQR